MSFKGALYIIGFVILVAITGVYQANLSQNVSPVVFIFFSSLSAMLFFSVVCFLNNRFVFIKKYFSHKKSILFLNISNFMTWFCYMFTLKYLEPAIAIVIGNAIGPLLVIIFSKYLRPKSQILRIEKISAVGLLISLIFILYMTLMGKSALEYADTENLKIGIIFAIILGIGQVLFSIYAKKLSDAHMTPSEILAWRYPLLFVVAAFLVEQSQIMNVFTHLNLSASVFMLCVFGSILPIYLFQQGVKLTEPIFISILMMLEPIIMFMGQIFDPRLHVSIFSYIGVALIVVFSLLSIFGRYYAGRQKA